jgi:hypothetical protein
VMRISVEYGKTFGSTLEAVRIVALSIVRIWRFERKDLKTLRVLALHQRRSRGRAGNQSRKHLLDVYIDYYISASTAPAPPLPLLHRFRARTSSRTLPKPLQPTTLHRQSRCQIHADLGFTVCGTLAVNHNETESCARSILGGWFGGATRMAAARGAGDSSMGTP